MLQLNYLLEIEKWNQRNLLENYMNFVILPILKKLTPIAEKRMKKDIQEGTLMAYVKKKQILHVFLVKMFKGN